MTRKAKKVQGGCGGMGSHKHGTSGHASRSPGYKLQRTREANALIEAERDKRPRPTMFGSVADALKKR
jgi:hypothetical protein